MERWWRTRKDLHLWGSASWQSRLQRACFSILIGWEIWRLFERDRCFLFTLWEILSVKVSGMWWRKKKKRIKAAKMIRWDFHRLPLKGKHLSLSLCQLAFTSLHRAAGGDNHQTVSYVTCLCRWEHQQTVYQQILFVQLPLCLLKRLRCISTSGDNPPPPATLFPLIWAEHKVTEVAQHRYNKEIIIIIIIIQSIALCKSSTLLLISDQS